MEKELKLYPLRISELEDIYAWGKETFALADLGYRDSIIGDGWLAANTMSEIMDTYMDRIVGDTVFSMYGRQFPIQMKRISCEGKMPLRVHPDDSTAESRYDALGKEKLWYILSCSPDARIVHGFSHPMDAAALLGGITGGTLENDLYLHEVKPGDAIRIKPGTVHGAIGKMEILEISQSSALDFCVYPFGQVLGEEEFDSSLDIIEALDFIEYKPVAPEFCKGKKLSDGVSELLNLPQFVVNRLDLHNALKVSSEKTDSFALYYCVKGKAEINTEIEDLGKVKYVLNEGQSLLLPAEILEYFLEPMNQGTVLLEAMGQTVIKPEFPPLEEDEKQDE